MSDKEITLEERCGSTLVKFQCGCIGFLTGVGKMGTYVVQRCDLDPEVEDDRLSEGMYFGDRELSPLGLHWSTQRPTPLSIEETLAVMSKVSGLVEDGMKWRQERTCHVCGETDTDGTPCACIICDRCGAKTQDDDLVVGQVAWNEGMYCSASCACEEAE